MTGPPGEIILNAECITHAEALAATVAANRGRRGRLLRDLGTDARFLARRYRDSPDDCLHIGVPILTLCAYCNAEATVQIGFDVSEPDYGWVPACRQHKELLAKATEEALSQ